MKTNIAKIMRLTLSGVAATAFLGACSDTFLEQDPLSFYEPKATYSTESGLKSALAQCDFSLRDIILDGGWNNVPMPSNYIMTDLAYHGKTDMNDGIPDNWDQKLSPYSGMAKDGDSNCMKAFWTKGYNGVKLANTVLTYIDDVDLDEATKNAYKGRAYFHRAMKYYHLVLQFGDIPLLTKLVDSPKQDYHSCSKEAIFQMLVHDLEFAVKWVPAQKDMDIIGAVNKEACMHLLAKCYLVTGDYAKAEQTCTDLITGMGHSLMYQPFGVDVPSGEMQTLPVTRNVLWDLHRGENVANSANQELLMPILNFDAESFTGNHVLRAIGCGWDDDKIEDPEHVRHGVMALARNNANYMPTADWLRVLGRGIGCMRTSHYFNKYLWYYDGEEDTQDLRHNRAVGNWVEMEDMTYNNPASKYRGQHLTLYAPCTVYDKDNNIVASEGDLLCSDTIRRWYPTPVYKVWVQDADAESNNGATNFMGASVGSNNNMYLFRLAETYLVRAEARFYQGRYGDAAQDVNEVRRRANAKKMFNTVTIGDIVAERARELFYEEWRQAELARVSWCLAKSGRPDEWGETYSLSNWDKQEGTELSGGSYWYKRCTRYNIYNHGPVRSNDRQYNYVVNKRNIFWPVPQDAITANNQFPLAQNYGYSGYNPSVEMWTSWEDAVAAE